MAIFPHTSSLAHSSLLVNSAMVLLSCATFSSTTSMTRLTAASTSGILVVSQSTNSRKYGERRDPRVIFTPSAADDRYCMEPCRLFIISSAMASAAPSHSWMASVNLA